MSNKTNKKDKLYIVICRNSNGCYVFQKRFDTKVEADKFINREKEEDKRRYPGTQYKYNIYVRGVDITDMS